MSSLLIPNSTPPSNSFLLSNSCFYFVSAIVLKQPLCSLAPESPIWLPVTCATQPSCTCIPAISLYQCLVCCSHTSRMAIQTAAMPIEKDKGMNEISQINQKHQCSCQWRKAFRAETESGNSLCPLK